MRRNEHSASTGKSADSIVPLHPRAFLEEVDQILRTEWNPDSIQDKFSGGSEMVRSAFPDRFGSTTPRGVELVTHVYERMCLQFPPELVRKSIAECFFHSALHTQHEYSVEYPGSWRFIEAALMAFPTDDLGRWVEHRFSELVSKRSEHRFPDLDDCFRALRFVRPTDVRRILQVHLNLGPDPSDWPMALCNTAEDCTLTEDSDWGVDHCLSGIELLWQRGWLDCSGFHRVATEHPRLLLWAAGGPDRENRFTGTPWSSDFRNQMLEWGKQLAEELYKTRKD